MKVSRAVFLGFLALVPVLGSGCGKDNKDSGSDNGTNGSNGSPNGNSGQSGGSGNPLTKVTVDLKGALGLAVVDPSKTNGIKLVEAHNEIAAVIGAPRFSHGDQTFDIDPAEFDLTPDGINLTDSTIPDGTKSLEKTDSNGNLTPVMTSTTVQANPPASTDSGSGTSTNTFTPPAPILPKVLTIAVSPAPYNEVFVHFESSFRFKAPAADAAPVQGDQTADGTYCQLFRVKGGKVADLQATAPTEDNLECLDFNHFVNNWQSRRNSVFQFDNSGNVYFQGQIPQSPSQVVYKWDRTNGSLTEVINANICVHDFLVTPSGGVFYTGTDSCNGGGGSSGGFFRYVAGGQNTLTEIARNWYNFIYEPVSTATTDKAIFFGPDPTVATTASWNTACIFNFDPAAGSTTAQRTSSAVTCNTDIWSWINMSRASDTATYGSGYQNGAAATAAWKTEAASRCESSGQIFAGGGSQISAIKQDSTGKVYVIGNVRKKNAGTTTCSVEVRGPHCKVDGMPDLTYTTSTTCTTASGTWVDEGNCSSGTTTTAAACFTANNTWNRKTNSYNSVTTKICTASGEISSSDWWSQDNTKSFQNVTTAVANTAVFRVNNFNCTPPASTTGGGDQWTSEYQGLGRVNTTTKTLSLLSGTDEQAIKLWIVNDIVYYSSYNSTSGHYLLRKYDGTQTTTIVDSLEVYNLVGVGDGVSLYIDGLDFSNNSYSFGTVLIAAPYTRATKTGLTGTLKTMVILPK